MECEGHINKRHDLQNEVQEGSHTSDIAETTYEFIGFDAPNKEVREEPNHKEEYKKEHMMDNWPEESTQ